MTEIPQHLLDRTRARRAALGLDGGDAPAAAAEKAEVVPAGAATPAPSAPAPVIEPTPVPERVVPHYVKAAEARPKVPAWAMPFAAGLGVWALIYAGTLSPPEQVHPALAEGAELYEADCASCHGATGGGGTGYAFTGDEVVKTFPNRAEHMLHVARGSDAIVGQPYGDPEREGGQRVAGERGVMPAFGPDGSKELTALELELVVLHERAEYGHEEPSEEYLAELEERINSDDEEAIDIDALAATASEAGATPQAELEGAE